METKTVEVTMETCRRKLVDDFVLTAIKAKWSRWISRSRATWVQQDNVRLHNVSGDLELNAALTVDGWDIPPHQPATEQSGLQCLRLGDRSRVYEMRSYWHLFL
ncbi:unnamed protein product [Ascophyllum nodosum]